MADSLKEFYCGVEKCKLCYGPNAISVPVPPQTDASPGRIKVLLIGEQPHRPTVVASGVVDFGAEDPTVERLKDYLESAGVARDEVMYTTSVMCLPNDPEKRGSRPSLDEAKNCAMNLRELIEFVKPRLIIPMGHTAVHAVQWAFKSWSELRQFILNYDVGRVIERDGVRIYPLYLASSSTLDARPEVRQIRDWKRIPQILNSLDTKAPTG